MSLAVLCSFVLAFYAIIWFFDSFFKSCMHYPYLAFVEGTGLKVGILNLTWTTTAFNRQIYRWSKTFSIFFRRWFTFGYIVTIIFFIPFSLWTLGTMIFGHFINTDFSGSGPEVKAVLPGINIPASDIGVYFVALALSSIIHELGHAISASCEDVQLISVGMYCFLIIPVAFVQLNTDHLNNLSTTKRLKIYCAGVWHNIVTAFIVLMLFFSTPVLFSLMYKTEMGVKVMGISESSPLNAERGIKVGDVVTAISGCKVKNSYDWHHCLHMSHEAYGLCATSEFVSQNDEVMMETIRDTFVECCKKEDTLSICFEYKEPEENLESILPGQYSCLKPRDMVKESFTKCTIEKGYACPKGMHCLVPSLRNHTHLIIIERRDDSAVLYLGIPHDLASTICIDQYFPKSSFFSYFSPVQVEKVLQYTFIFSMGIGFINIMPCYGTDGHHISRNLIQLLSKYFKLSADFVTFCTIFTIVLGTGVMVPTLCYLFYKAIALASH